jgi:hypothetical protein
MCHSSRNLFGSVHRTPMSWPKILGKETDISQQSGIAMINLKFRESHHRFESNPLRDFVTSLVPNRDLAA